LQLLNFKLLAVKDNEIICTTFLIEKKTTSMKKNEPDVTQFNNRCKIMIEVAKFWGISDEIFRMSFTRWLLVDPAEPFS
jgi:hypothetical protein